MSWLIKSSIGRKLVMSISGLALILFLTFHMSMNLVALFSEEAYNAVCEFLGANWYALVASMGLAVLFIVHIVYAFILTLHESQGCAVTTAMMSSTSLRGVEWASQNMMALGVIIVLGIFLHLFNFWAKMQLAEIIGQHDLGIDGVTGPTDGAGLIRYTFSNPIFVVLYLIWLGLTVFHLSHGFWSSLHTIGFNNRIWFERLRCISNIYTTIIVLGFAVVVIYYFIQALCGGLLVVLLTTVHPTSKLSIPLRLCLR